MLVRRRRGLVIGIGAFGLLAMGAIGPGPMDGRVSASVIENADLPSTYRLHQGDAEYDATAQIDAYAQLVYRTYRKAADDAAMMQSSITALLDEPSDETLAAARSAWLNARVAYLQSEAFRFYDGPIEAIEGRINAWPLNEGFIDYVRGAPDSGVVNNAALPVSLGTILSQDQVTDEADVTTGWHAIEFLLWGQDFSLSGPGDRPVADYLPGTGSNDRRRDYLRIVTQLLVDDLNHLAAQWCPDDTGNFAARLRGMDQFEALGRILNGMAILAGFEMMGERLGVALDSGDQEDEHSCFSDNTRNDFIYDLRGIRNIYFGDFGGTLGAGLNELVRSVDPALDDRITALLHVAEAAMADLDQPFDGVLASSEDSAARAEAEAAFNALSDLSQGLVDVGLRLGVLVQLPV